MVSRIVIFEVSNTVFEVWNAEFEASNITFEISNVVFEILNRAFKASKTVFETSNVIFRIPTIAFEAWNTLLEIRICPIPGYPIIHSETRITVGGRTVLDGLPNGRVAARSIGPLVGEPGWEGG
uniref:Uncharacterized protein n=1 Tax=Candidatus Kentrum eta TaxID=2126337 RepID=A0A450UGN1_9GAMM|nr:MAG: hypothetical protein BECKH772A_GA0070896_1002217 [Candidatus Kentron sp. H]VFJ91690.1 MAG: hypothetical protein BECKH772B_GA0070898_1002017 [Candidatus Kentron sp. H]VFJ98330.1 MAG: hypothetical protein BECKH772C_GA0070978_1002017 [Candidatus Kentron sp. H]